MEEEIIYYADNPNIPKRKVITTFKGEKEYRCNCSKINLKYYTKNVDCFFVGDSWKRVDSNLIVFDHSKNKWVLTKNNKMIKGITAFEGGLPIFGTFAPDPINNVQYVDRNGNLFVVMNEKVCEGVASEDVSTGRFVDNSARSSSFRVPRNIVDHKNKGYNIEDNPDEFEEKVKVFSAYNLPINKDVIKYSRYLEDVTFGVEIESIAGFLPEHIQYQTGTIICRDGSLHAKDGTQGPEYTTIPMSGAKGVQAIINLCKEITKRNKIDHQCSVHFHLGNLPTSRLFLVSLYKLSLMIQDDIFKMFPYYKIDEPRFAGKEKNYCAKLDPLSRFNLREDADKGVYNSYIYDNYLRIFNFLSGDVAPSKQWNRTRAEHPKKEKWNRRSRYHWINLINIIFSKRNTVEFRLHHGSSNAQKIVSWLFICNAIVKTAMTQSSKILRGDNVTIQDVLNYYAVYYNTASSNGLSIYLNDFYNSRVEDFKILTDREDFLGIKEIENDSNYFFNHSCFSQIFK